jgi:hypothetical protein
MRGRNCSVNQGDLFSRETRTGFRELIVAKKRRNGCGAKEFRKMEDVTKSESEIRI